MKKGLFWVVNHNTDEPILITKLVNCNIDGKALESVEYTSKSRENFNHKIEWGKLGKEITKGKEYNYFPRGRVEINKGRITIFLNPDINNEVVINKVIKEFELQKIENIRIISDGSSHYEYQRMFDYKSDEQSAVNDNILNLAYEWNIDITTPQYSIFDKPLIDITDTELDGFIEGMCEQFYNADYKLINKP